jgi:hypothetical protein
VYRVSHLLITALPWTSSCSLLSMDMLWLMTLLELPLPTRTMLMLEFLYFRGMCLTPDDSSVVEMPLTREMPSACNTGALR